MRGILASSPTIVMIGLAALFTSDLRGWWHDDVKYSVKYSLYQTRMVARWWSVLSTVIDLWSWEENVLDDTKRAMLDHCLGGT